MSESSGRLKVSQVAALPTALIKLVSEAPGDFQQALNAALRADSGALDVARVSFWALAAQGQTIKCETLYLRASDAFESGLVLSAKDYPAYFDAMRSGRVIDAGDAHTDPRTSEFSAGYLAPFGIGAMLDVPVFRNGALAGVVCHEHVGGARAWTHEEQHFALAVGQAVSLAMEVRARTQAEEALRENQERLNAIIESALDAAITTDDRGNVTAWNTTAEAVFGWNRKTAMNRPLPALILPRVDFESHDNVLRRCFSGSPGALLNRRLEVTAANRSGRTFPAELSISAVKVRGTTHFSIFARDITLRRQAEDRLRSAASHDSLTGLANRARFHDVLRQDLARLRGAGAPGAAPVGTDQRIAVLFVDIDDFKEINDRFGHATGDQVLVAAGERIAGALRSTDLAARMGGDEFVVLLAGIKAREEAERIAARLLELLRQPYKAGGQMITKSVSIGIAMASPGATDAEALIRSADAAMYRAKASGKDRFANAE
jgi:diguanylate cyclase (GGDEF)-like protein/PAS domain S-box-containing protein